MSIYEEKFFRNIGTITLREQKILRATTIAIVGLGGTGGTVLECLIRAGCEHFILFDRDRFDLTNCNRQLLATDDSLDRKKIDVAIERAKKINKNIQIQSFESFDSKKLKGVNLVIDATDNVETRIEIAYACTKQKISYVFCSASFSRGMVSVFTDYSFEKAFQLPKSKTELKKYNTCTSVLSVATMFSGTLAANQVINYLLGKPFVKAPDLLFFDLFSEKIVWKERLE